MSYSPVVKNLVERNRQLALTHEPKPFFSEIRYQAGVAPSIIILTCVDPRCNPQQFLGLGPLEAAVFRNVCGHVTPNIHEIAALSDFLQVTDILVIHHTDCGAITFPEEMYRENLKQRLPADTDFEKLSYGAIQNLEQSVRDDLQSLRASPLVPEHVRNTARGFVFDVKTGLLHAVEN